ncbi:MAG TPA: hypothetical protein DEW32_08255 [Dehalococcoidia bacterium]|nr:hypothetical protein [Dehalococcoidia bacterium]
MYRSNRAFVSRRQELTELTNALDDAMSGTGRLVMLVGEPGIGKSRAAQELAPISEKRGAQTLWAAVTSSRACRLMALGSGYSGSHPDPRQRDAQG